MLTFSAKPRSARARRQLQPRTGPGPGLAPLWRSPGVDEPMDSQQSAEAEETAVLKGWHDSSVELKRGLDVTEDVPLDALPPDVLSRFSGRSR